MSTDSYFGWRFLLAWGIILTFNLLIWVVFMFLLMEFWDRFL